MCRKQTIVVPAAAVIAALPAFSQESESYHNEFSAQARAAFVYGGADFALSSH
jgi:hypothetical protein